MASGTASYASGDQTWRNAAKGDATVSFKGKKRKTVFLSQQPRPLFVAEAELKVARYFTRIKKTLLVLYGAQLLIVDVAALDAADSTTAAGDISVAVLKLLSYSELLDVSVVGSSKRILKIEYGDSSDKPKLASSALFGLETATTAAMSSSHSAKDLSSLAVVSVTPSDAYSTAGQSTAGSQAGAAALRVTYDSFTLLFKDAATAQEAAAALLFHRAQHAAVQQWLHQGLHAGFRCDPVVLRAVPAALSSSTESRSSSGGRSLDAPPGGAATAGIAGIAAVQHNRPGPYSWGSVSSGWGCSVALPASWGSILDTAAEQTPADADDSPDVTLEDLSRPVDLARGPEALQLQFTTPVGLAVATIKPQHLRATLLNEQCKQILAVPVHTSSSACHQHKQQLQGVPAGFSWTVNSKVPAGISVDGSSGNLAGVASSASSTASLAAGDVAVAGDYSSSSGSSGAAGLAVSHTVEVFAAVTVELHRTPHTAGRWGVGRIYNPAMTPAATGSNGTAYAASKQHIGKSRLDSISSDDEVVTCAPPSPAQGLTPEQMQLAQLAVCAALAAVAIAQLNQHPAAAALQLVLAAVLAGIVWLSQRCSSPSSSRSLQQHVEASKGSKGSSGPAAATGVEVNLGSECVDANGSAADADVSSSSSSSNQADDLTCCGWSIKFVTGDVVATPSRYLQLQISIARADKGLAQLRQRLLSVSQSLSLSAGGAVSQLLSESVGLPVLVSDPEPAWLHPDNKQRFLNAKPTLAASQEQAQRTHKWRVRMDVDNVLRTPCPGFHQISTTFPTYTLLNQSPEGHAVVMMKVGAIKDLCDLVFNSPEGKGVTVQQVEQTLALFNEYLVHVAAPDPLPAGFQVQVYDMEGFKLGYVNGDMISLFKILVRFGHYYPERLQKALVINAPPWFTYPWKLLSSFLDANTSAKVVVVGSAKAALPTLIHHMGGLDNVPVAWGGKNTTPLDQYPDHQQMMEFARRLNAGEQPLSDCKKLSGMFAH